MNLLTGIRKEDVFVFGTFLGIPEPALRDIEMNYGDNFQRFLTEVGLLYLVCIKKFCVILCMVHGRCGWCKLRMPMSNHMLCVCSWFFV